LKIHLLSRYGRKGASSRLRTLQYVPLLESSGDTISHQPLFDDEYLRRRYAGEPVLTSVVSSYLSRFSQLFSSKYSELLWVEYEALPWFPHCLEKQLIRKSLPYVVDYDDAVFHRYDLHRSAIVRSALGTKIDSTMKASDLVLAGNSYLADRAKLAGSRRIEVVPTVVDASRYAAYRKAKTDLAPCIGWIGSPITWNEYMPSLVPLLSELVAKESARFIAVGAGEAVVADRNLHSVPWSEEAEVSRIQEMDIGIMPLTDTPWARGKCGYKLIQYMACGLPVVASPVGVNTEIVEHGVNGLLASTEDEWRDALTSLLSDYELRHRMGQAGRLKVEKQYSLKIWGPRVATLLRDVVEMRGVG